MTSSVDELRSLERPGAAPHRLNGSSVMTATRSGQNIFLLAIVGIVGFVVAPSLAPAFAAVGCWLAVALIMVGIRTYQPTHQWPWVVLAIRWATVGIVSALESLHLITGPGFVQGALLEITRISSLVAIAALFLYARPRRLLDATTGATILVFGFASVLAMTPSTVAHLSTTRLLEPTSKPAVFASLALVTWFALGYLVMRLGPVLPTALGRIGLGAWLAIGVVGSIAVASVITGLTRPALANVSYLYAWIMALSTAAGALHPSMAHLRPTSDRVWTPVVQRAAYVGAIFIAVPLAILVPQVFDTEHQELACYATLTLVVFVSIYRIDFLNRQLSGRNRFMPRSQRELVSNETRQLQGLLDEVGLEDLRQAADVVVVTFTLRGLRELRLLVGSGKQVSLEEHWAGALLSQLPHHVRAVRLRPGCVVALLPVPADTRDKCAAVLELARRVHADTGRVADGEVVLDLVVGASELRKLDVPSLELAVGLAEQKAASLRNNNLTVATLEANEQWHTRLTAVQHLRMDESLRDSLSILGEPFVDLHTNEVVGKRIVPAYEANWDIEFTGTELGELVSEAQVDGRYYATVMELSIAWAVEHLPRRSVLVVPVSTTALLDDEYVSRVLRALAEGGRAQLDVWLEIPASNLTVVNAALSDRLDFIALQGAKLMVGDFGRQYADLAALATLPFDALALNERFVSTVGLYLRSGVLAANVASMAWDLDYVVVAGGIKFEDQRSELAEAACKYAWGPLFGEARLLVAPMRVAS